MSYAVSIEPRFAPAAAWAAATSFGPTSSETIDGSWLSALAASSFCQVRPSRVSHSSTAAGTRVEPRRPSRKATGIAVNPKYTIAATIIAPPALDQLALADWLRANGRYRFLLTAPPLRLTGAPEETIKLDVEIDATDQLELGKGTAHRP